MDLEPSINSQLGRTNQKRGAVGDVGGTMREVEVCGCCWELFMSSLSMTELGPSLLIFSLLIVGF